MSTTTNYDRLRDAASWRPTRRLGDAASAGEASKPAKTTTGPYQDALQRIWVSEPLPAWQPGHNHLSRLTQAPKHHLADPALAAALTGMTAGKLLSGGEPGVVVPRDGTYLGALFESSVALGVRVFAQAAEARVFHLRTRGGDHEVDLVVEAPDGGVVAIEVKLTVSDADCRHLTWLRRRLGAGLRRYLAFAVRVEIGPAPPAVIGLTSTV